ncbi:regulatory protein, FmdB family [Pseudodesulfovibrio mercurii]|uniref:Regulatory protein, FmdB family n=1 Tax=Pseudodesulfovibrio mercurii TaxID=641491 RepID=F0JFF7_9BACT|nr:zinc ribbon domain-containing protein [Pseudodesulfovibrio mercurii]EGB14881.1 regulatory protein, FmdB family [Pseudodesulfovibrio mercurii]
MPIYEYVCKQCGREFEELVFNAEEPVVCPKCGSTETEKLMSACATKVDGGGPNLDALHGSSCGSGGG